MSHFDEVYAEVVTIRRAHFYPNGVLSIVLTLVGLAFVLGASLVTLMLSFPAALIGALLLHVVRRTLSSTYEAECARLAALEAECERLKRRVAEIYDRYGHRQHAERFKDTYELRGLSLPQLEQALAVGMYREQREVFVTCFMRLGIAQRVTATIGSLRRCSNSDNIARWKDHCDRLACDEILQYHNHPVTSNTAEPSRQDFHTTRLLASVLGHCASRCRSLLLYWNQALEWRIIEYDAKGNYRLIREFDVTRY